MYSWFHIVLFVSLVQFSHSVMSNSLRPHEPQHTRPPCPSPTPRVHPNLCPSSRWCHPIISSSVVPFSSCPQSFPESGSSQISQLFTSGGQSIGVAKKTWKWEVNKNSIHLFPQILQSKIREYMHSHWIMSDS